MTPPWLKVTGDIRLLRFLRGFGAVAEAAAAYRAMLAARAAHGLGSPRAVESFSCRLVYCVILWTMENHDCSMLSGA
jgi:hypothetical protein